MSSICKLILSNNKWISVSIPKGHDPCWVDADFWFYAAVWVAAKEEGHSDLRCEQIAETEVIRRLYGSSR